MHTNSRRDYDISLASALTVALYEPARLVKKSHSEERATAGVQGRIGRGGPSVAVWYTETTPGGFMGDAQFVAPTAGGGRPI